MGIVAREPEERFWRLVNGPWCDPNVGPHDCWLWMGSRASGRRPKGLASHKFYRRYGRFRMNSAQLLSAHRASLMLTIGPPPDHLRDAVAAHLCDEPLCVHPGHLAWQTQRANIEDAMTRRRLQRVGGRFATTGLA